MKIDPKKTNNFSAQITSKHILIELVWRLCFRKKWIVDIWNLARNDTMPWCKTFEIQSINWRFSWRWVVQIYIFLCWHPSGVYLKFICSEYIHFHIKWYAGIITNRSATISNVQMVPLRLESWTSQWHHLVRESERMSWWLK